MHGNGEKLVYCLHVFSVGKVSMSMLLFFMPWVKFGFLIIAPIK